MRVWHLLHESATGKMCFTANPSTNKFSTKTRRHFSRKPTTRLPTVWATHWTGLNMSIGGGVPVQWGRSWASLNMFRGRQGLVCEDSTCDKGMGVPVWWWWCWGLDGGGLALYGDPTCKQNGRQTDRHDWKHYLPATSLAGGNNSLDKSLRLSSQQLRQQRKPAGICGCY